LAEKLLIQRVSPLIPVIHKKNGILGSRRHVVSFFQDITDICSELPRLPSDVTMIKVVRTGTTVDRENLQNIFSVNRYKILNALLWLKVKCSVMAQGTKFIICRYHNKRIKFRLDGRFTIIMSTTCYTS
jgi:hypothetical protein